MVIFDPTEPLETITAHAASEVTTLTKFFKANAMEGEVGDEAWRLTYQEFPKKFIWNKNKRIWSLCQQGLSIGRMYFVCNAPTGRVWPDVGKGVQLLGKSTGSYGKPETTRARL